MYINLPHARKLAQPLERTGWRFFKPLRLELPYDPAIPLLGIYPEKTVIQKDACSTLSAVQRSTVCSSHDTEPKRPSTEEWVRKMGYVHTREYYSPTDGIVLLLSVGE